MTKVPVEWVADHDTARLDSSAFADTLLQEKIGSTLAAAPLSTAEGCLAGNYDMRA
jgi:hypothetical protein